MPGPVLRFRENAAPAVEVLARVEHELEAADRARQRRQRGGERLESGRASRYGADRLDVDVAVRGIEVAQRARARTSTRRPARRRAAPAGGLVSSSRYVRSALMPIKLHRCRMMISKWGGHPCWRSRRRSTRPGSSTSSPSSPRCVVTVRTTSSARAHACCRRSSSRTARSSARTRKS